MYLSPSEAGSTAFCSSLSPASAASGYTHSNVTTMSWSPSTASLSPSQNSTSRDDEDVVQCRWDTCCQTYDDPETLYQHLCNDHVGRKSTNNLCLACKWEGCDVSCAKRDHITSHIRVHTPLKPHVCATCGKAFKRPQDLKKHERIHTEAHQHKQVQQRLQKQQAAAVAKESLKQSNILKQQQQSDMMVFHVSLQHQYQYQNQLHRTYAQQQMLDDSHCAAPAHTPSPGFYPTLPHHPTSFEVAFTSMPLEAGRDASFSSLSPFSSHLSTPQSAHSPADSSAYSFNSYLALAESAKPRPKAEQDFNSYMFPSQGSLASHQTYVGVKRGYDDLLSGVDGLFEEAKKKKSQDYNATMADRLTSTFGGAFDDATLQALLMPHSGSSNTGTTDFVPLQAAPASTGYDSTHAQPTQPAHTNFDFSKLTDLNSWLLKMGLSAARGFNDYQSVLQQHQHQHMQSQQSHGQDSLEGFDLSSLTSAGLNEIPGFDENLFDFDLMHQSSQIASTQGTGTRSIASMPRHHSVGHAQTGDGVLSPRQQGSSQHLPSILMSTMPHLSFDSMRTSRASGAMPTLARMEAPSNYRHVQPLMRAAPSTDVQRSTGAPAEPRKVATTKTKTSAIPLYPNLANLISHSNNDAADGGEDDREGARSNDSDDDMSSRRLPTPYGESSSHEVQTLLPPISILIKSTVDSTSLPSSFTHDRTLRQPSQDSDTLSAASPDASESPTASSSPMARSRPSSPPFEAAKLYPSLPPIQDEPSDRIARLGLSSSLQDLAEAASHAAAANEPEVPIEVRRRHVMLIKMLLVAINFPERLRLPIASQRGKTYGNRRSEASDDSDEVMEPCIPKVSKYSDLTDHGQSTPRAVSPESPSHGDGCSSDWFRIVNDGSPRPRTLRLESAKV